MAVGRFSQKIVLDGLETIVSGLRSLGQSGTQAFQQVKTAVDGVNPSLARLSAEVAKTRTALSTLGSGFGSIASVATRFSGLLGVGVGIGGGGILAGLVQLVRSSSSAGSAIGGLAKQTGSTAEEMSGMVSALAQTGIATEDLSGAFRRLAVRVENEWPQIQKQIVESADKIASAHLAVRRGLNALAQSEQNFQRIRQDNAQQELESVNSVQSAELNLLDVHQRLREAQGLGRDPDIDERIAQQRLLLSLSQAEAQLEQAKIRQERQAADAAQRLEEAEVARQSARLQLNQLRRQAAEEEKNDIKNLIGFVNALARGASTAGAQVNVTADNIIRGLIGSIGPAVQQVGELQSGIAGLANAGPNLRQVILRLADVFKNMKDETLKTAIGVQLFGRETGVSMVKALSQGSAAILAEEQRLKSLGLTLNDQDVAVSRAFNRSRVSLTNSADAIRNKIGTVFGPAITRIMDAFRLKLEENSGAWQQWSRSVADAIDPATSDIKRWEAVLNALGLNTFPQTQAGIDALRKELEKQPNLTVWDQVKAFFSGFIEADIEAAKRDLAKLVDEFRFFGNAFVDAVQQMLERWKQFWIQTLTEVGDFIRSTFSGALGFVEQRINAVIDAIRQFLGLAPVLRNQATTDGGGGGFAGGGLVHGPGTATSDSILARLSRGEFVVRAAAVQHYGPQMLAAINAMRLPLRGFSWGGLVDGLSASMVRNFSLPGFAGGGLVASGGSPVTIVLPDGRSIGGLTGNSGAIEELRHFAALGGMASGGRKPSGYRGG